MEKYLNRKKGDAAALQGEISRLREELGGLQEVALQLPKKDRKALKGQIEALEAKIAEQVETYKSGATRGDEPVAVTEKSLYQTLKIGDKKTCITINNAQPQFGGVEVDIEILDQIDRGISEGGVNFKVFNVEVKERRKGSCSSDHWEQVFGDTGIIYIFIVYEDNTNRLGVHDVLVQDIMSGGKKKRRNKKSKKKIARKSKIGRKIKKSTIRK